MVGPAAAPASPRAPAGIGVGQRSFSVLSHVSTEGMKLPERRGPGAGQRSKAAPAQAVVTCALRSGAEARGRCGQPARPSKVSCSASNNGNVSDGGDGGPEVAVLQERLLCRR